MEIKVTRKIYSADTTIGRMSADGKDLCWVLEDVVRPKGAAKVDGKTAIPAGRYQVTVNMSNRFQRLMCLLIDVPNFAGVRIHGGNTSADTEGCLIVAANKISDTRVQGSCEKQITAMCQQAIARGEKIYITIEDTKNV